MAPKQRMAGVLAGCLAILSVGGAHASKSGALDDLKSQAGADAAVDIPEAPAAKAAVARRALSVKEQADLDAALIGEVERGDVEGARERLARGAGVNAVNGDGVPALVIAARNWDDRMTNLLLEAGASVDGRAKAGETALMEAARGNIPEIVKALLQRHADPNIEDVFGYTALMDAASSSFDSEIIDMLMASGSPRPDVNHRGGWWVETPLSLAAARGNFQA